MSIDLFFILKIPRPPRSTRPDPLFPCTTLFRSRPSQSKPHPQVLPGSFAVLSFLSPVYFQRQPHFECDSLKHSAVSGLEIDQSSTMIAPDQPSSDDAHKDHYLLPARADPAHLPLGKDKEDLDRKSTRLNSSHSCASRMPSFA